ncbi:MAG: hypothetical protein ACF8PN_16790 [Phycisphaerales bacterium]
MRIGWLPALGAAMIGVSASVASASPLGEFKRANPGVQVFEWEGRLSRLYGAPFAHGATPEASAESFISAYAEDLLGVNADQIRLVPASDEWRYQPIMFDRDRNDFKYFALYFEQAKNGVRLFESRLTLLVGNEPGYPLVWAKPHNLRNLDAIAVPAGGAPGDQNGELIIFNKTDGLEDGTLTLARRGIVEIGQPSDGAMVGVNGGPAAGGYDLRELIIDAQTGAILRDESLVRTIDVVGHVDGWATPGLEPDSASNPPELFALPNTEVSIVGGNRANTNQLGDFVISHSGSAQVTVRSDMRGPSLSAGVFNEAGGEISIDRNVTPPGPADFEHNASPTELTTSQVNAMLQTSIVHTWLGDINPTFPGLSRSFRAFVNISSTCNAFYNGSAINFYRSGGGCVNTAYTTVVYHEYGHKIVDDGASFPSGDYHEGMADAVSQVLTDDPVVGSGFFGPGTIIRSGENTRNYPCSGGVHFCGQVISGSVWHTREALTVTEPTDYLEIIADLTINQVLLHSGGIDPGVTIDFLTLDDDDNNIVNGTPHYYEIDEGFSRHNMPAPPLELLDFTYPNGLPDAIDPDGGTTVRVEVVANVSNPAPGTGELHYDTGSGFQTVAMVEVSPNIYDAVFPAVPCESIVEFYFSAETTDGSTATDPAGAPARGVYTAFGARSVSVVFEDDFEDDRGWTVTNQNVEAGAWVRGDPAQGGTRGDPADDFDGSGKCFITGNTFEEDLDGGPTILLSPSFDASAGAALVSYARWFTNDDGDDRLVVEISNDNGNSWTQVESVGNSAGWTYRTIRVEDFVTPSASMRMRFTAADQPNNSVTEAAVDAFQVAVLNCDDLFLEVEPLVSGQPSDLTASFADPGETVYFVYSLTGEGDTFVPQLNVTLGLDRPRLGGSAVADGSGVAVFTTTVPNGIGTRLVWIQAAQVGKVSNVVLTQTN